MKRKDRAPAIRRIDSGAVQNLIRSIEARGFLQSHGQAMFYRPALPPLKPPVSGCGFAAIAPILRRQIESFLMVPF